MKNKFRLIFTVLLALVLAAGAVNAQPKRKVVKRVAAPPAVPVIPLAHSLPASDVVISINVQKVLNVALPQFMGQNSAVLVEMNKIFADIKAKAGVDIKQFKQAAIGIKYKQATDGQMELEPVIMAGGNISANAYLGLIKLAAAGKYQEESVGGKTVYVLHMDPPATAPAAPETGEEKPPSADDPIDRMMKSLGQEVAVGALDDKTLVVGSVARVRETLSRETMVDPGLFAAIDAKPLAMVSFAGNLPQGLAAMLKVNDPEFTKLVDSMKIISGYFDMNTVNTPVMLSATTHTPEQAQSLNATLAGLHMIGKSLIGTLRGTPREKAMFGRLIDNVKISATGNNVQVNLIIAQSDLNLLFKKFLS